MKTLESKQKWFKEITLSKADQIYVALDVHKKSISVAIWLNGRIEQSFSSPADHLQLIEKLKMQMVAPLD